MTCQMLYNKIFGFDSCNQKNSQRYGQFDQETEFLIIKSLLFLPSSLGSPRNFFFRCNAKASFTMAQLVTHYEFRFSSILTFNAMEDSSLFRRFLHNNLHLIYFIRQVSIDFHQIMLVFTFPFDPVCSMPSYSREQTDCLSLT